jgi:hypothetical protein
VFHTYNWVSQLKVNDLRTEFSVAGGDVEFFNRHNGKHQPSRIPQYMATEALEVCRKLGFGTDGWNYLDGGLMCCKNRQVSGITAIWDILVLQGEWLLDTTYQYRYDLIAQQNSEPFIITVGSKDFDIGLRLSEHIFVPRLYDDYNIPWQLAKDVNAAAGWSGKDDGENILEGVYLKNANSKLKPDNGKEVNNTDWGARSRFTTGRSRF